MSTQTASSTRTPAAAALSQVIGLRGFVHTTEGLALPVTIRDAKVSWGATRFLVEGIDYGKLGEPARDNSATERRPVDGFETLSCDVLCTWVDSDRVKVVGRGGIVPGSQAVKGGAR